MAVRLPTSRAYWNLRAEQVMDKVFDQDALNSSRPNHLIPVDVDVHEPPPPTPPAPAATTTTPWLLLIVSGIAVAGAVNIGWLISSLLQSRSQLDQERNLLMLERLQAEASTPAEPEPEWMASLEPPAPPSSLGLALSPAAPELLPIPTLTPMPQLTGVVQGPGGNSSAIFQLGTTSLSAGIGESIGSSGWRLDSISSGGAVISQHGQQRTLSVGGLF
ncbi:pilus assembly protein PilZ [Synechococcus sp. A15-28]|uniref:pilus assembly protein PilZ n=1 Tax=Synechococcus sp. A15-28 TaxID=1050638 RepID=UPI0025702E1E|nr:pilus assembly protein PilZ [Synechococcus sp. A15-28]